ncbi:hypothetical protein [Kingella negevensis]|uniref:hypothetical protein n=1 Tax=Kingella negevensis TaxID=1522312 RepID=UPI00254D187F|nr:hypothetical protein [Kingella negevensis]MDK4689682.1 hypothetical protein [Kingella negevensis]
MENTDELDAKKQGFRDRAKADAKRKVDATDSEHWLAFCFDNEKQVDEFLESIDWAQFVVDYDGRRYLNGEKVAAFMGVKLPNDKVPFVAEPKIDKAWAAFCGVE